MAWETLRFNRQELYRLVWERPVQEVARGFGVSGVALGKACRRLAVPVPSRGYWARKSAGKEIPRPPLPGPSRDQHTVYEVRRWADPPGTCRRGDAKVTSEQVRVPDELTQSHTLTAMSSPLLRQARELREDLLEREACLDIDVQTHAQVGRAVRIMDTLLKALEAHGGSIEVTPPGRGRADAYGKATVTPSQTLVRLGESIIRFGIHEGVDRVPTTPKKHRAIFHNYVPRTEYKSVPNGRLTLAIRSYHPGSRRQTWRDGKRQRLEDCLADFVSTVLSLVETERLENVAERQRQREAEERCRLEAERERRRALEVMRVKDLRRRLDAWTKARGIRELAAAIEENARADGDALDSKSETAKWLSWARAQAERLERRAITGRTSKGNSS